MMVRRFQRSTSAPAKGPITICGNMPTSVATASTVAEPLFWVRYQISANCTSAEPNNDRACPDQIVKKRPAQVLVAGGCELSMMQLSLHYDFVYNRRY